MRDLPYLLRFFVVVPPVAPMMITTFGALAALGAAMVVRAPDRAAGALAPVLLLQLFAASSGFMVPGRRGHYDLLLTRGGSRVLLALTHWAASIAPGVASWLLIAAAERAASAHGRTALLASGTWAAVTLVSTLPWALTVRLPRFSGGIGWLLVLATASGTLSARIFGEWDAVSAPIAALAGPAWTFLVYPFAAVGRDLSPPQALAVAPGLLTALCAMTLACRSVARAELPLEAGQ